MKTIQKSLLALLLAFPLLFSSCLSSSSSEPDPLAPGLEIYNAAVIRNSYALLPIDLTMRLALVLGEAEKQGLTGNEMLSVKVDDAQVRDLLFPREVQITREGNIYTISLAEGLSSYVSYAGSVIVDTKGRYSFAGDDDQDTEWTVTLSNFKYFSYSAYGSMYTYTYDNAGEASLRGQTGNYWIEVNDITVKGNGEDFIQNWRGTYTLNVGTTAGLAYSAVKDKDTEFEINSRNAQDNLISWSGERVKYKAFTNVNTSMLMGIMMSGTITARFVGSYDPETYPSGVATGVVSSNGSVLELTYNGMRNNYTLYY